MSSVLLKSCCDANRFVFPATLLVFFAPIVAGAELHVGDSVENSVRAGGTETY
jgi:hypothetical protein